MDAAVHAPLPGPGRAAVGAAGLGNRARRGAAVADGGGVRPGVRRQAVSGVAGAVDSGVRPRRPVRAARGRGHGGRAPAGRQPVRLGLRHAGPGRHRPADGLRPARQAVLAPDRARPEPPHHHQHGGRRLPRRRGRLRDREPGDERPVPARHVDHRARGDVRLAVLHERDDRAAVADGGAVPVLLPALLHQDPGQPRGARQRARGQAARPALRNVRRDEAGQELRPRIVRAAALQDQRRDHDGCADRDHLAAVAVLGGGEHHHHPRHRAGGDRRRPLRDERHS